MRTEQTTHWAAQVTSYRINDTKKRYPTSYARKCDGQTHITNASRWMKKVTCKNCIRIAKSLGYAK